MGGKWSVTSRRPLYRGPAAKRGKDISSISVKKNLSRAAFYRGSRPLHIGSPANPPCLPSPFARSCGEALSCVARLSLSSPMHACNSSLVLRGEAQAPTEVNITGQESF